jgi:endoglucanase
MMRSNFWPRCFALLCACVLSVRAAPADVEAVNPFRGRKLYVDPNSPARKQADAWQRSRPQDAALMRRIADQPQVIWLGDWNRSIRSESDAIVSRIARAGALPVLVVYNITNRDCGSHSAGGARGGDDYRRWIVDLARGLKGRPSVIILEPDALAANDCLPLRLKDERYVLLREAADVLTKAGAAVYIDAGHAKWQQPNAMADRLKKGGIDVGTGFSLNVSNFHSTRDNIAYGNRVSELVSGKHYVIDTSRNGTGKAAAKDWCNPRNQALGEAPTTDTRQPLVDAYLWIKVPGQSDGACNGGPSAGTWWAEYALELSRTAQVLSGTLR